MKPSQYPFAAIVGQEPMKTALLLNAVDPALGGVLIRGHKGTGKSTAARALAVLLPQIEVVENCPFNSDPHAPAGRQDFEIAGYPAAGAGRTTLRPTPFVELPLNATEDRLVGSLHIEKALHEGKRSFEPGLLAAANRGILYVDEVNLLEDHLVDMLLDVAASGVNIVEREGISFTHPARFILIGTMNPEEGELRPQFLDRFGLCAPVQGIGDQAAREMIVSRRLSFEADPEGFVRSWARADAAISRQVTNARNRLPQVQVPEDMIALTVRLTRELQVQGHRADVAIVKAARAHAALLEKSRIDGADVAEAARLSVPHRMKSLPLDSMDSLRERIDAALGAACGPGPPRTPDASDDGISAEMVEQMQVPGSMAAGSILFSFLADREKVFEPDTGIGAVEIEVARFLENGAEFQKRSKTVTAARGGRYRAAAPVGKGERDFDIAFDATLRQAAVRRARGGASPGKRLVERADLRKKEFVRPCRNLIVFLVDSSDSMGSGAQARMKAAKGAVLAILRKAYQERSEVAMVAFGGDRARVVLPPTSSVDVARRLLDRLPTGGATPFADGLFQAWQIIRSERLKNRGIRPILLIVSDGEANVALTEGADPQQELAALAGKIGQDGIPAIVIDAAAEPGRRRLLQPVAAHMKAAFVTMRDITAPRLLKTIRSAR